MFPVGKTRFNDQALREASRMTIHNMSAHTLSHPKPAPALSTNPYPPRRDKRPAYNLISNNCQNFAVELLKAIQVGAHREFGSTFAIYQRATGAGAIKDLFAEKPEKDPQQLKDDEDAMPPPKRQETLSFAQQVMEENTKKLDLDGDGRPG